MPDLTRAIASAMLCITLICLPLISTAGETDISSWLAEIQRSHPSLAVSAAQLKAAEAQAEALAQPLYNPSLVIEGEDAAERSYAIGIDQDIDLSGKRDARRAQGTARLQAAQLENRLQRNALFAEVLRALAVYRDSEAQTRLSGERLAVMERFAAVVDRQRKAGETGLLDWQLAQLALAEAIAEQATTEGQNSASREALKNAARLPLTQSPALPELPAAKLIPANFDALAAEHPAVRLAQARETGSDADVAMARAERGIDPSLGLRVGKDGEDDLIGLSLSFPLRWRNPLRAEVAQALAEQSAVQAQSQDLRERARIRLEETASRYRARYAAWQRWQGLSAAGAESLVTLEKVWKVGELSATDYLVQLKQRLDAQAAGLALLAEAWLAWADWLDAANGWQGWLNLPADSQLSAQLEQK